MISGRKERPNVGLSSEIWKDRLRFISAATCILLAAGGPKGISSRCGQSPLVFFGVLLPHLESRYGADVNLFMAVALFVASFSEAESIFTGDASGGCFP